MLQQNLLFCTELLGLRVFDTRSRLIGRVRDAALVPIINASRVDRFLVGGGWAWLTIRYDQVRALSLDGIYLSDEQLTPYHADEYMLRISRDLLDQQIIDALGRKVVRVNDVTFEIRDGNGFQYLDVLEVDIGVRSIFRRLLQGIFPARLTRRLQQPIAPNSIRWEYCNIVEPDPQRRLRLNISHLALEKMHPPDLADIVEDLSPGDREAIIQTLHADVAADALSEMDPNVQASILESLETEKAAEIIEEMAPDQAAHALSELEEETSSDILEEMTEATRTEVGELIEYREHTAGSLMNTELIALPETGTIGDGIRAVRANLELAENQNVLYLIDSADRLTGAVSIPRLFTLEDSEMLQTLSDGTLIKTDVNARDQKVTALFDKYNLMALPVVDESERLAGVITADDVISLLRQN